MQLLNIPCKLVKSYNIPTRLLPMVSVDAILCYNSEKYKANLGVFSLLLSGVICS